MKKVSYQFGWFFKVLSYYFEFKELSSQDAQYSKAVKAREKEFKQELKAAEKKLKQLMKNEESLSKQCKMCPSCHVPIFKVFISF